MATKDPKTLQLSKSIPPIEPVPGLTLEINMEPTSLLPEHAKTIAGYYRALIEAKIPEGLAYDLTRDMHSHMLDKGLYEPPKAANLARDVARRIEVRPNWRGY